MTSRVVWKFTITTLRFTSDRDDLKQSLAKVILSDIKENLKAGTSGQNRV